MIAKLFFFALLILVVCCGGKGATAGKDDAPYGATRGLPTQKFPSRSVGQNVVPPGLAPSTVGIVRESLLGETFFCNGALIASNWVLTARPCATSDAVGGPSVDKIRVSAIGQKAPVMADRIVLRPGMSDPLLAARELALVRLEEHIGKVPPVRLARRPVPEQIVSSESRKVAVSGTVIGWGATQEQDARPLSSRSRSLSADVSTGLLGISVQLLSREECNGAGGYGGQVGWGEFCARPVVEGTDACEGFSGAPLLIFEKGLPVVQGIVAWGGRCGINPTVYTDVYDNLAWIENALMSR